MVAIDRGSDGDPAGLRRLRELVEVDPLRSVPSPATRRAVPSQAALDTDRDEWKRRKGRKKGEKGEKQTAKGEAGAKSDGGEKSGKAEKAGGESGAKAEPAGTSSGQPVAAGGQGGGALTPDEQRQGLDKQLQTSMAEYDDSLLREQQKLQEKQARDPLPERAQGSGSGGGGGDDGESAGGAGGEGESGQKGGGKPGTSGKGQPSDRTPGGKKGDPEAKGKAGEPASTGTTDTGTGSSSSGRSDGGTPVTAPREGGAGAGGTDASSSVPADVGDGKDDDVVARQLREAAMKEKDPAIREKLWQEYRDYKKGTGKD